MQNKKFNTWVHTQHLKKTRTQLLPILISPKQPDSSVLAIAQKIIWNMSKVRDSLQLLPVDLHIDI